MCVLFPVARRWWTVASWEEVVGDIFAFTSRLHKNASLMMQICSMHGYVFVFRTYTFKTRTGRVTCNTESK